MKLTIVGSGTGIPSATRGSPAILVQHEGTNILMDSGPGSMHRLARLGIGPKDLHYIFYTHFHPDHTLDFLALCFALRNPEIELPERPIRVIAPQGFRRLQERLQSGYGDWIRTSEKVLQFFELQIEAGEMMLDEYLTLNFYPVRHTDQSLGYRIEDSMGRSIAYSGDTGLCDSLVDLGREADLFVLECSFPEGQGMDNHLTPSEAGAVADRAKARKLILTHFYPQCEGADIIGPCASRFHGPIVTAEDFMTFETP